MLIHGDIHSFIISMLLPHAIPLICINYLCHTFHRSTARPLMLVVVAIIVSVIGTIDEVVFRLFMPFVCSHIGISPDVSTYLCSLLFALAHASVDPYLWASTDLTKPSTFPLPHIRIFTTILVSFYLSIDLFALNSLSTAITAHVFYGIILIGLNQLMMYIHIRSNPNCVTCFQLQRLMARY